MVALLRCAMTQLRSAIMAPASVRCRPQRRTSLPTTIWEQPLLPPTEPVAAAVRNAPRYKRCVWVRNRFCTWRCAYRLAARWRRTRCGELVRDAQTLIVKNLGVHLNFTYHRSLLVNRMGRCLVPRVHANPPSTKNRSQAPQNPTDITQSGPHQ